MFVQTGRIGDILNTLPLALRHFQQTGEVPFYMVASQFKGILEGVSYVEPVIFPGPFEHCIAALYMARQITSNISLCQIYGQGIMNLAMETSFIRESWACANADVPWGTLPLVIDQRDRTREARLIGDLVQQAAGRKIVLVATGGISSPFPYGKTLLAGLQSQLDPDIFMVINLAAFKCEQFFDFLGLYEIAHCLVSVDTGFQHLAPASDIPVISIINPSPSKWHGSAWRPQHTARFYYHEFPQTINNFALAIAVVDAREWARRPDLIHVFADWRDTTDEDTERRRRVALDSWEMESQFSATYGRDYWQHVDVTREDCTRDGTIVGDAVRMPFIRDVISHGLQRATKPTDVIVWSNADICFAPGLTGNILETCRRHGAAFCQRWDFPKLAKPFITTGMVRKGKWYPGCDLFAFTVEWWNQHGQELPDLLMGREKVDEVFRQLIKYYHGGEIEAGIYHEKHASFWERPENFHTNGGNLHNRALAKVWSEKIGVGENDHVWWTTEVDRRTR